MDNTRPASKGIAVGTALGALAALPALFFAVMSAGAGHGDYLAARALFPLSMLLTLIEGSIGPLSMAIGLLQLPVYGGLLGWAIARRNFLPISTVACAHVVAVILCFSGILPNFS